MDCRPNCGACCIAPSINTPLPGMPNGKPAGVACIHLINNSKVNYMKCAIFDQPERPAFCASLKPSYEMCGDENQGNTREYAIAWLNNLEHLTKPNY